MMLTPANPNNQDIYMSLSRSAADYTRRILLPYYSLMVGDWTPQGPAPVR